MRAVLTVGHNLADHTFGQTDRQAAGKAAPSAAEAADAVSPWQGRGACLAHFAQYHLVMTVMVAVARAMLPLPLSWAGLAAGFAFSAGPHAFFDRRWPVHWLLERTGATKFAGWHCMRLATADVDGGEQHPVLREADVNEFRQCFRRPLSARARVDLPR
ncbi:hypothetical protein ACIQU6_33725 [Streptomyces sp. NPDC090442]|uniref:hypothetical protein n=1 Tax=Streptomyces sp. NPDC090442 TaxID=3365962 RepID=UPI00380DE499